MSNIIPSTSTSLADPQTQRLVDFLRDVGLPYENIIAEPSERAIIGQNLTGYLQALPAEVKRNARYLSKFVIGAGTGLFDYALHSIRERAEVGDSSFCHIESVATILQRSVDTTIGLWLALVEKDQTLMSLNLSREERARHLPRVIEDLVRRLRTFIPLGSTGAISVGAIEHGILRRKQGYLASMMVEESRMLQVSIFDTLQRNLETIDLSVLLIDVMTIADEVDFQLAQAMESYNHELALPLPA